MKIGSPVGLERRRTPLDCPPLRLCTVHPGYTQPGPWYVIHRPDPVFHPNAIASEMSVANGAIAIAKGKPPSYSKAEQARGKK